MIQQILNTLYRHPLSNLKTWQSFGGYLAYRKMLRAEKQMKLASKGIFIKSPKNNKRILEVYFLTGKRFWHQTVFCAYSLQKKTDHPIKFIFFDDGSLSKKLILSYQKQVPNSVFVMNDEIEERLKANLFAEKYPFLHHKREIYPHIKKLIDVHFAATGWKLVLDSDMLFWRQPEEMLAWLKKPKTPFYILDIESAYGFPLKEMEKLTGSTIPKQINVGIIGLKSDEIDFHNLEKWGKALENQYGGNYYLEQALSAMLIGDQTSVVGDKDEYIVYPSETQVKHEEGILHHYVAVSKKWYFNHAWQKI
ncbi:glycosyl transferase [Pedobacter zeae]|uniref:Glycosyl transferase n=2 Tax=Pedobacter zeae TaxID=1737356 RepID=A0A7W6P6A4_9SPHI|nr:glycosyl transferase [Pedobacter zeae]MBB4107796.1 hypothetical protein [Pedobacter zeae]